MSRPVGTIYGDYTDYLLFASDLALLATLIFWLASKSLTREPFKHGPAFITLPIIALTVLSAVSVFVSIDPPLSIYHTVRLILLAGLVFYIIDQVKGLHQLAIPVALQIAIQSIVGISQFLRQSDIGLQILGEYPLKPEWNGVSVVTLGDLRWLRAYGLSDHPNILGGCLAFGLLILLGSTLIDGDKKRPLITAAFALGMVCLFLTFSRAGWLAFGLGLASMGILLIKHRDILVRGGKELAVALMIAAPFIISHANLMEVRMPFTSQSVGTPSERQSLGEREELNAASIAVFVKYPILGAGIGTLPQAIQQEFPYFPNNYQPAHFTLIDAAAELGLIGATVYAAVLTTPWIAFIFGKEARQSLPMVAISATLLAATIVGFLDYYTWLLAPGRLWQYVIWGLWALTFQKVRTEASDY